MSDNAFYIIIVCLAVTFLYILMVIVDEARKNRQSRKQPIKNGNDYTNEVNSLSVTPEEFYKVLNFMILYGVIDLEEYNKIQQKGLPFTG